MKTVFKNLIQRTLVAVTTVMTMGSLSYAQEGPKSPNQHPHNNLASNATNPAAALIQLQFQNLFIPNSYHSKGAANNFIVQPVYPLVLGPEFYFQSFITRTTIPVVTTTKIVGKQVTGLGDTTILGVPVHKTSLSTPGEFTQWGPVITTSIPTGSRKETTSSQFSLGGGVLGLINQVDVFEAGDSLLMGFLGYNIWSVSNTPGRKKVN